MVRRLVRLTVSTTVFLLVFLTFSTSFAALGVDLTFTPRRATSGAEIDAMMKAAAAGPLKGVLQYSDAPLVSIDFNHDPHSSTYDSTMTRIIDGKLVKVCAWYDNEWGFSNRMLDVTTAWSRAS